MFRMIRLALLIVIISNSLVMAKKEPTAVYQNKILTDSAFGYSLDIGENWKVKTFKEPNLERAFLQKKNYSVNPMVKTYGGDYTIPTIVIYAQGYDGTLDDFELILKMSLEEHKSDNEIITKLGLLTDGEFVTSGDVVIDSINVSQLILKRNYSRLLASDALMGKSTTAKMSEQYINDHEVHEVYLIKKTGKIIVIQAYCEREFYQENMGEFHNLVLSLR